MTRSLPGTIRRLDPRDLVDVVHICNVAVRRGESTYGPGNVSSGVLRAELFDVPAKFESYVWDGGGNGGAING